MTSRKLDLKLRTASLLLVMVAVLLPSVTQAQQPDANTLVIGQSVDVETLDPSNVRSVPTGNVISHLFATLNEVSDTGEFVPYLAKDYKLSDDGTALTYHLNDGLTCQDGEPLTAEDVVYTLDRAVKKDNNLVGNSSLLGSIGYQSATADDKLTVTIKLKGYTSTALGTLAGVYIHCKDSFDKMSLQDAASKAVGSGPYRVVEWKRDDYLLMEKVKDFPLRKATVDRIYWRVIPEASTRAAELMAKNVDIITNVVPDQADAINKSGVAKVQAIQGTRRMYVGMSQRDLWDNTKGGKALKDTAVRVALQYAIDVPKICATLLGTPCERAATMVVPPNNPPEIQAYPYDPKKAEELLDKAGYPRDKDGVRFELTLMAGQGRYLNDVNVVDAICQYLTDVGVKTTCKLMDFGNQFIPLYIKAEAGPLFFIGSGGSAWSAVSNLADLSSPTAVSNATRWSNPAFFAGWDKLAKTRDPQEERTIVKDMLQVFHDDPPWILLYFQPDFYGVSNRIDWQARRDERIIALDVRLK
jgi:peptide/nickel transport system substrate-binding protein